MRNNPVTLVNNSVFSNLVMIVLLCSVLFSSCKVKKELSSTMNKDPDSLVASMERSPCFGKCPVYKMELYASGYALYRGIKDAPLKGLYTSQIERTELENLLTTVNESSFFSFQDQYINPHITDIPTVKIYFRSGEKKKMVELRSDDYPDPVRSLDQFFDRWIHTQNWNYTDNNNE